MADSRPPQRPTSEPSTTITSEIPGQVVLSKLAAEFITVFTNADRATSERHRSPIVDYTKTHLIDAAKNAKDQSELLTIFENFLNSPQYQNFREHSQLVGNQQQIVYKLEDQLKKSIKQLKMQSVEHSPFDIEEEIEKEAPARPSKAAAPRRPSTAIPNANETIETPKNNKKKKNKPDKKDLFNSMDKTLQHKEEPDFFRQLNKKGKDLINALSEEKKLDNRDLLVKHLVDFLSQLNATTQENNKLAVLNYFLKSKGFGEIENVYGKKTGTAKQAFINEAIHVSSMFEAKETPGIDKKRP